MERSPTRTMVPPLLAAMTAPAPPPPLATLAESAAVRSLSRRYNVGSSSRRGASLGRAVATVSNEPAVRRTNSVHGNPEPVAHCNQCIKGQLIDRVP